jgi:hypothetical protein
LSTPTTHNAAESAVRHSSVVRWRVCPPLPCPSRFLFGQQVLRVIQAYRTAVQPNDTRTHRVTYNLVVLQATEDTVADQFAGHPSDTCSNPCYCVTRSRTVTDGMVLPLVSTGLQQLLAQARRHECTI